MLQIAAIYRQCGRTKEFTTACRSTKCITYKPNAAVKKGCTNPLPNHYCRPCHGRNCTVHEPLSCNCWCIWYLTVSCNSDDKAQTVATKTLQLELVQEALSTCTDIFPSSHCMPACACMRSHDKQRHLRFRPARYLRPTCKPLLAEDGGLTLQLHLMIQFQGSHTSVNWHLRHRCFPPYVCHRCCFHLAPMC